MIIDKEGMKAIEQASGIPVEELMERVGEALFHRLLQEITPESSVLFLCGRGNNGGDGFVAARLLRKHCNVSVYLPNGRPSTPESKHAYRRVSRKCLVKEEDLNAILRTCDLIVDAVYGFGFHGSLDPALKQLFSKINRMEKRVISVDINSGCECDTALCDSDAIRSDLTLAIDCWKPFHKMRKEHGRFRRAELLDLSLPHPANSSYLEMDEEKFFAGFPEKQENDYKSTYGLTLLIGGSYGMAGALALNITGAKTVGTPYIHAALPHEIYGIAASRFLTPVFHPYGQDNWREVLEPLIHSCSSLCFGSGSTHLAHKGEILDLILQESRVPVVLDAEALRLLEHNMFILRFARCPVILTPHIGEFAMVTGLPKAMIADQKIKTALEFARSYRVIVVLKGANTVAAFPNGELYLNQSGCQALAQAGSGDLLTGILTGILTMTRDVQTAVCMAVWLHGYLAEYGMKYHSMQNFPLESYPALMDELFRAHGR